VLAEMFPFDDHGASEEKRQFWLDRGTAVHAACEYNDKGTLDLSSVDDLIRPRLDAWRRFRLDIGGELIAIEAAVEHPRLAYCGRLDRVLRDCRCWYGGDVIVDIKSGKPMPHCALQTMGYKMAWEAMHPRRRRRYRRCAVELRETGKYDLTWFGEDDLDQAAWIACLTIHAWKERKGK